MLAAARWPGQELSRARVMAQSTLSTATLLLATLATHPCHGQAPTHPVKIGDIVHNILFPQSELIGTIHQTHISFLNQLYI